MLPPIVIFCYNRPEKFRNLVASIRNLKGLYDREIFVFIDGKKKIDDEKKIEEVFDIAKTLTSNISLSESNKGLAQSVISGVSEVFKTFDSAIILEDDLILHPDFLIFMDAALERFKNDKRILSVCGFGLKVEKPKDYSQEIYLARRSSSWGWATWADRWNEIDWDLKDYDKFISSSTLKRKFNLGGSDMASMLKGFKEGKNNSWAIRFCYHQFKNNLYSVHPFKSLVRNEGFGEEASNCRQTYNRFKTDYLEEGENFGSITDEELIFNNKIDANLRKYHSIKSRIYSKLRSYLSRI